MNKNRKLGVILLLVGLFIPTVLYPFTSIDRSERLYRLIYKVKNLPYESPKFFDREVAFVKGEAIKDPDAEKVFNRVEYSYLIKVDYEGRIAVPYKFILAFGITMSFIGMLIITLSTKTKVSVDSSYKKQSKKKTKPSNVLNDLSNVLVKFYRDFGRQNNCAPSSKTSDEKIIEIYSKIATSFRKAAEERGDQIPAPVINKIALFFFQVFEDFGDDMFDSHLKYEIKSYLTSGLREGYSEGLRIR